MIDASSHIALALPRMTYDLPKINDFTISYWTSSLVLDDATPRPRRPQLWHVTLRETSANHAVLERTPPRAYLSILRSGSDNVTALLP